MSQQPISCPHENARFLLVSFFFFGWFVYLYFAKKFLLPTCWGFFYIIFVGGTHGCMLIQAKKETNRETNNRHKSLNCQQLLKRVIMSKSTLRVERQAPVATEFFFSHFFQVFFCVERENFQLPKNAHLSGVYLLQHFFAKVKKWGLN